jgi:hypothetical protein
VDTLDEPEDWMTANNPRVMRELRQARRDDQVGKFNAWKRRFPGQVEMRRPCCTRRTFKLDLQ